MNSPFSITAEFLLGTYRGHRPDERPDEIPSVARLHAALISAAGSGPRAVSGEDGLIPNDVDLAALRWLEENPPDTVCLPRTRFNDSTDIAHRNDGTISKKSQKLVLKKKPKPVGVSVAVNGSFTWTWSQAPPPEVCAALEALCPDVPCLGTSESPVRLTTSRAAVAATHTVDLDADLFDVSSNSVDLPQEGRTAELLNAHNETRKRTPNLGKDRWKTDEKPRTAVPPYDALRPAKYVPITPPMAEVPWPKAVLVPLHRPIPERSRLRFAVAAHRALVSLVGDGAPPLLTGTYPAGMTRPGNRIALQVLDAENLGTMPNDAPGALALLIPGNARQSDVHVVLRALNELRFIRGPRGMVVRVSGPLEVRAGDQFWPERKPGMIRLWRTSPPAIPDTRGHGRDWTFVHAVLLSLGFVWQESSALPVVRGRGATRYRELAGAAADAGAAVITAEPLRSSDVNDYVHRTHKHAVVRPYRAVLSLGNLGGERALQAVGQTRHLGGGLLVPIDVPEGSPAQAAAGAAS